MSQDFVWNRTIGSINGQKGTMISQVDKNGKTVKSDIYIDLNGDNIPDVKVFKSGKNTSVFTVDVKNGVSSWDYSDDLTKRMLAENIEFKPFEKKADKPAAQIAVTKPTPAPEQVVAAPVEVVKPEEETEDKKPQASVVADETAEEQVSEKPERKQEVVSPAAKEKRLVKKGETYDIIARKIRKEIISKNGFCRLSYQEISVQIQAANPDIAPNKLRSTKAKSKIVIPELVYTQKLLPVDNKDKKFTVALNFVLSVEGGYSNNKKDKGGPTNKGVTHETYKKYLIDKKTDMNNKALSTDKNVKNITDAEVAEIYYNYYYNKTNIEEIADKKIAVLAFDTAVNCGPEKAEEMLKASGGDVQKFLQLRRQHYAQIIKKNPSQVEFKDGWENRLVALEKYLNELT